MAFVFGLQTLRLKDFSKIYQLYGLKPKNKGRTNFYECCDLTKKVYLLAIYFHPILNLDLNSRQSHAWNSNIVCICLIQFIKFMNEEESERPPYFISTISIRLRRHSKTKYTFNIRLILEHLVFNICRLTFLSKSKQPLLLLL